MSGQLLPLFGLRGLFGNDGKEGIPGLAFFIQGEEEGQEGDATEGAELAAGTGLGKGGVVG